MRSRRCLRSRRSDCSICATPVSRPLVQTLVARNNVSVIARSVARSPTTDSAAPYIGEESTTRPPSSAKRWRTSLSGARSVAEAPTSKVRHVPSPTAGIFSRLDGMGPSRGEGATPAFGRLAKSGRRVRRPDLSFATADHYVLTSGGSPAPDAEVRGMVEALARHTGDQHIVHFGVGEARRGIVHVIGPEQGLTVPGITLVCGDSHTATHGPGGGVSHAIEYAGSAIHAMSMDERMTVCNMSIEAGARAGMIAPDDTTFAYVEARPFAPRGDAWSQARAYWKTLPSDAGAAFDREVALAAGDIAPTVTWGTSPQDALPITARVPDPAAAGDPGRRESMARALAYMGLRPGTPLAEIPVDRVFIGSAPPTRPGGPRA